MPPKKKPTYASPAAAKAGGQAVLSRFFPVKSKRGGQKKKELQRGPTAGARPGGRGGNTSLTFYSTRNQEHVFYPLGFFS